MNRSAVKQIKFTRTPSLILRMLSTETTSTIQKERSQQNIFQKADRIAEFKDSIWTEFTPLANQYKAVNLGQGFPSGEIEDFVASSLQQMTTGEFKSTAHQYARAMGDMALVQALSKLYSPLFERQLDPMKEILITNGASGALYDVFQAHINPGDEVIIMEPFFDLYITNIIKCGAKPIFVSLKPQSSEDQYDSNKWKCSEDELRSKITSKTKAIIVNNPHNPTGKVFTRKELESIASIAKDFNLLVFSDEVYEFLVFKPQNEHIRIATLPGMWERTITIGSAGKTFSITGYKVGWCIGPANLIFNTYLVHQYNVFSVATPLQKVVAQCLERTDYLQTVHERFQKRAQLLQQILEQNHFKVVTPHSGYFLLADIRNIDFPIEDESITKDYNFCRYLPKAIGVAAIPPSAFYSPAHKKEAENYARFCFCKEESIILQAKERLEKIPFHK